MQFRATDGLIDVELLKKDQCYSCLNESICPLIKCLQCGLVHPSQSELSINYCEIYQKRLEVVQDSVIKRFDDFLNRVLRNED